MQIRQTEVEQIIDLRWRVLREGMPRQAAAFDGDHDADTLHFAAFAADQVVGCATFLCRSWNGQPAWQLRGMAVEPTMRGSGVGTQLLQFAETQLAGKNWARQLWCNARTPATGFYERLGWKKVGDEFVVDTAGPHFRMTKAL